MTRLYLPSIAVLLVAACNDHPLQPPVDAALMSAERVGANASGITVMTQNLYVGADVDLVIHALGTPDPGDDLPALQLAIETVGKTDFPARASHRR